MDSCSVEVGRVLLSGLESEVEEDTLESKKSSHKSRLDGMPSPPKSRVKLSKCKL